jgi:signal peptidase II
VLAGILYFWKEWIRDAWSRLAFILIVAGALGNLWDRIIYGHVIDFINFRVWPIFNVADSCISIGGTILVILGLYRRKDR